MWSDEEEHVHAPRRGRLRQEVWQAGGVLGTSLRADMPLE